VKEGFFFEKKKQKTFALQKQIKVFWFFFSKKNTSSLGAT